MKILPGHRGLWRRSASILLMNSAQKKHSKFKESTHNNSSDSNNNSYCDEAIVKVLMVKRSEKSSAFTNAHVFPGGLYDKTDSSLEWLKTFPVLNKFKVPESAVYPDLLEQEIGSEAFEGTLCPHISFRMTSIRELFEETGLLLAFSLDSISKRDWTGRKGVVAKVDNEWRKRIHNSPSCFLTMCQELNLIPDIWMLHDWSTWLTPIISKDYKRYDTQFYAAFIDQSDVNPSVDKMEVTEVKFHNVTKLLELSSRGEIILPPPQFYELHRIKNINSLTDIINYTVMRGKQGTHRWFPVRYICADGVIGTLPGDTMYPQIPDIRGEHPVLKTSLTIEECMRLFPNHNRMLHYKGSYTTKVAVNIKPPLGQIS